MVNLLGGLVDPSERRDARPGGPLGWQGAFPAPHVPRPSRAVIAMLGAWKRFEHAVDAAIKSGGSSISVYLLRSPHFITRLFTGDISSLNRSRGFAPTHLTDDRANREHA